MSLTPRSQAHLKTYWIAYAVLLVSLSLTFAAFLGHERYIRARDQARFSQEGEAAFDQVQAQLQVFLTMMKGVRALFSANPQITPPDLAKYFSVLKMEDLQLEQGLQGVGVIFPVRPEDQARHVATMRRHYPRYWLNTKATNRTLYPLIYLEKLGQGMETAPVGWDIGQDRTRLDALERCAATGQPVATARTHLFYDGETNGEPGFVIYLPIHQRIEGSSGPVFSVVGFVFCAFDSAELWRTLFKDQHELIDIEIYDGPLLTPEHLFFDRDQRHHSSHETNPRFEGNISADFFGRCWTFFFYSRPHADGFFERGVPLLLLALGVAGSCLLFGFVFFQANSRATAERLTRSLGKSEQSVRQANDELAKKVGEAEDTSQRLREYIAQNKLAESRLAAEKERLTVTLRSISDAVVATDVEGRILLMNPVAEQMAETCQLRATGQPLDNIFTLRDPQSRLRRDMDFDRLLQGKSADPHKTALLTTASGREILVQKRAAPIRDGAGLTTGAVFVYRDVTQERKIEEELLRASKLESVGLLAGGIAHDFNNVLTGIVANLSLLRDSPGLPAEVVERLELLEKTAYKARQLTAQLLTFAKGGTPIKQTASIPEIIRESAEFALRGSNVRAEFHFPENLSAVEVDTGQISQVVQNLIINGKQAMPKGGVIEVTAAHCRLDGSVNLPLPAGDYVRISFRDTGVGIKREHLGKIFDPYFTTKSSGTGLGLATAYSILKRHGGLVTVESEWEKGSIFHMYLPASNKAPLPLKIETGTVVRGSGRILAMDDEPAIRSVLLAILQHYGYTAVAVADGHEALREYQRAAASGEPYSAVIMDLTIPGGMGGRETLAELLRIDPQVRAIVSSGYSNDPVLAEYKAHGFLARVEKPYRLEELAAVLHSILASK